jgi:rifampicin phosphotransferase
MMGDRIQEEAGHLGVVRMTEYISFFEEIDLGDVAVAGGKGANLGNLVKAGFVVPPGFSVLAPAYDEFLAAGGLEKRISEEISRIDFSDPRRAEAASSTVRGLMHASPIPVAVEQEIRVAYRDLVSRAGSGNLVAVRSSVGTRDLSASSFPGQMDTYHNLAGEDEVVRKVRECWASVFSYRGLVARHTLGIDHFNVFIAPLVQAMVPAERAGVIFTANPLNGRTDQMVVNACFGLGEGVVSGAETCDHMVIDRQTGEVVEADTGRCTSKTVLDEGRGGGNTTTPLSAAEEGSPAVTAEQVEELVTAAGRIEELYDEPQDVEWAYGRGELFILQSRRITGLGEEPEDESEWVSEFDTTVDPEYPCYTLSNISEVLPGVLTPLTLSGIESLDYGFVSTNTNFGLMGDVAPGSEYVFLGVFYNRVHLNLSVVKRLTTRMPGTSAREFERMQPHDDDSWSSEGFKPTLRALLGLAGPMVRILWAGVATGARAKRAREDLSERIAKARTVDFENIPYHQYLDWLHGSWDIRRRIITLHITASQFAVVFYDFVMKLTEKWFGDTRGVLAARLVTGLQNLESAQPSLRIWDLADIVRGSDHLRVLFEDNEPEVLNTILAADRSADAARFATELRSFLDDFGYRGVLEAELMLSNWEEDPSYVFSMIRNYLRSGQEANPREAASRQEADREKAYDEVMSGLAAPRRLLFRLILDRAQRFIALREFMKAVLIRGIAQIKRQYRILSVRLSADGVLQDPLDMYFLTIEEVEKLVSGKGDVPVEELVARRRREYERNMTVKLPEYSRGRPRPLAPEDLDSEEEVEVLCGIAVSRGRVTGRARVITDPRKTSGIQPGEILVAPVTDAAWTPLFVTAGGIVVDVGGPLSHGSIVAREFGIPGVLNVGIATRLVRDGQMVTVDGSAGKVYLHPDVDSSD